MPRPARRTLPTPLLHAEHQRGSTGRLHVSLAGAALVRGPCADRQGREVPALCARPQVLGARNARRLPSASALSSSDVMPPRLHTNDASDSWELAQASLAKSSPLASHSDPINAYTKGRPCGAAGRASVRHERRGEQRRKECRAVVQREQTLLFPAAPPSCPSWLPHPGRPYRPRAHPGSSPACITPRGVAEHSGVAAHLGVAPLHQVLQHTQMLQHTQVCLPGLRPPGGRPRPPPSAAPQAPRPQRSPR
mmetsp:Transcript_41657/g.124544  ORF Transcript_41657/g.124544 Transcript_41657/m.124544 type:complete len:250 (+) Transcript_41657:381-1130(+)